MYANADSDSDSDETLQVKLEVIIGLAHQRHVTH